MQNGAIVVVELPKKQGSLGQVTDNFKILVGTLIALECFFFFMSVLLKYKYFQFFSPKVIQEGKTDYKCIKY